MFCPKCGKKLREGAHFCPKCGKPVSPPSTKSESEIAGRFSSDAIVTLIGLAVLLLAEFMPMLNLNLYVVNGSYSMFDIIDIMNTLDEISGYSSGASTDSLGLLLALILGLFCIWVIALVAAVFDIVCVLRKKKTLSNVGAELSLLFGGSALIAIMVAKMSIGSSASQYLGSYASYATSIISSTGWLWLLTILALCLTAFSIMRGKSNKTTVR